MLIFSLNIQAGAGTAAGAGIAAAASTARA